MVGDWGGGPGGVARAAGLGGRGVRWKPAGVIAGRMT